MSLETGLISIARYKNEAFIIIKSRVAYLINSQLFHEITKKKNISRNSEE